MKTDKPTIDDIANKIRAMRGGRDSQTTVPELDIIQEMNQLEEQGLMRLSWHERYSIWTGKLEYE